MTPTLLGVTCSGWPRFLPRLLPVFCAISPRWTHSPQTSLRAKDGNRDWRGTGRAHGRLRARASWPPCDDLEAQQRAGGRVYTLREPFADGLYVDAGASQIPANHYLTLKYVRLFGLELVRARPSDQASVRWIRGQRLPVNPGEPFNWPFDLTPEEESWDPKD